MATVFELQPPPPLPAAAHCLTTPFPSPSHRLISLANPRGRGHSLSCKAQTTTDYTISRRNVMALIFPSYILSNVDLHNTALAQQPVVFREYIDTFDGYSFQYPQNWIQVRGAGADVFFRDPFVLDENLSLEISSPSSSKYKSVEDLGSPQEAAEKVLKQYLTEFMSTRLGVRRESNILSTSSRVVDDGRMYYQVERRKVIFAKLWIPSE